MSKSKPYYVATLDRNKYYMPKDDPSRKSKQKRRIADRLASQKKSINSTEDKPSYESAIIFGRSNSANLLTHMYSINYLMNLKEPFEKLSGYKLIPPLKGIVKERFEDYLDEFYKQVSAKSQQSIVDMYNILSNEEDEIIGKKEAYRRMKSKAVTAKYAIQSDDNSKQIHLNSFHLAKHLKAYLYAMIYPPIFENCSPNSSDIIFSKYPALLKLWCNMLEEAIILDGFIDCINKTTLRMLDKRYDAITFNDNNYTVKYKKTTTPSTNHKNILTNLYIPNISFNCRVREFASANNPNYNEHEKGIKNILQHKFFQSGNRGINMHYSTEVSIQYIPEIYNEYIDYLKNEHNNYLKKCYTNFNGKISNLTKIFPLYNLCLQSHLLDFVWHDEFDRVDFHLTEGFMTNYVLHKIMKQNILVIEKIADLHKDEEYHYDKKYICNDSTELSLSSTIESYDLHFLRLLIKQCSDTFRKYDLHIKKSQAKSLICIINDSESILFDDFFNNIIERHLLAKPDDTVKKLETILEKSKDYYHKIYEDNHNWNIEFPC